MLVHRFNLRFTPAPSWRQAASRPLPSESALAGKIGQTRPAVYLRTPRCNRRERPAQKSRRYCDRRLSFSSTLPMVQAAYETRVVTFWRRRIAKPTAPMPTIIMAQEAGSGTAPVAAIELAVTNPVNNPPAFTR